MVITKYCHLGATEGLTLGQYFENVVWETRGDPRTLGSTRSSLFSYKYSGVFAIFTHPLIDIQCHFPETMLCGVPIDEYGN